MGETPQAPARVARMRWIEISGDGWNGRRRRPEDVHDVVIVRKLRCPCCLSTDIKINATRGRIRYHVCQNKRCGFRFKSIEDRADGD